MVMFCLISAIAAFKKADYVGDVGDRGLQDGSVGGFESDVGADGDANICVGPMPRFLKASNY
jgi:hypothetical protein